MNFNQFFQIFLIKIKVFNYNFYFKDYHLDYIFLLFILYFEHLDYYSL